MNKNILIVLAGGFVIAILVAVMVQAGLSDKKPDVSGAKTEILIAARDLRVGTDLSDLDVKWQEWPQTMVFPGAVLRSGDELPQDAVKGRLKERVAAGQPIHKSMMVDASKSNLLAASLREGYRAVGVQVRLATVAGGLIGVGDHVDVVLTYTLTRTGASTIARKFGSETILENVRVLGIDNKSIAQDGAQEGSKKTKSKQVVTLEVDPVGAEKIALANEMGDLTLALRPLGDTSAIATDKATTDIGLSKVLSQMVGGTGGGGVRVYNGTQVHYAVSGGPINDTIGRDENDDVDMEGGDEIYEDDMLAPEDMLDAVRDGISDGISRRFSEDEE